MRKQKIGTRDGGTRKAKIPRVGFVRWNGETGELELTGDDAYMHITQAVAGLMLTGDQVNMLAIPTASVYPMYGNSNAVRVVLDIVTVNIGEQVVHDVEALKPWLGALGKQVEDMGLHKATPFATVTNDGKIAVVEETTVDEPQRRTPDDRGNVPPWNPK